MTGLEIILLLAFAAVAVIAYVALIKWSHYKQWYYTNDNWWEAMLSKTEEAIKTWHSLYVSALNAAQYLDLQVSDLVYESQLKRDYQKEIADCKETIARKNIDIATITQKHSNSMPRCKDCGKLIGKQAWDCGDHFECDTCHEKAAKAVEPAKPIPSDLTDAPFEGLDGVKEGSPVLFSDGVVRKVRGVGVIYMHGAVIWFNESATDGSLDLCFNAKDGTYWNGKHQVRAIRIATELDKKLYQFADDSKKMEKPLLADAKVGWICQYRNGEYDQIANANYADNVIHGIPHCIKMVGGICYPLSGHYTNFFKSSVHVDSPNDIIHTEPIAPEGSKEWAWQMMLLGNLIIHSEYSSKHHTWSMDNKGIACKKCGKVSSGDIVSHHIIPLSKDVSLRYDITNGITLCVVCHRKEHQRLRRLRNGQRELYTV